MRSILSALLVSSFAISAPAFANKKVAQNTTTAGSEAKPSDTKSSAPSDTKTVKPRKVKHTKSESKSAEKPAEAPVAK